MHLGINKFQIFLGFLLISTALFAQPKVSLSGPGQSRIGMSTNAKVRIINDGIHGPARMHINIPQGWQLEKYPGELASMSQTGNQVRVIWLEFPIMDTIDVNLLLRIPDNSEKGTFSITGSLDYLKNEKKISAPALPHSYKILKYYTRVQ